MANLFCFGLGYSASHYVTEFGGRFFRVSGTVRSREKAATIASGALKHAVEAFVFDGSDAKPEIAAAVMDATVLLVSVPPREAGDPVLAHFAETIAAAPHLRSIVYLSTVGVYGDHKGEWIDETAPPAPVSERSRERLDAERAWIALGARAEKAVAILRLSGIYGPGQNALTQLKSGRARRIDKPGQFFNRIHVLDIAQAIDAAFDKSANGIFNVTDDKPTPQGVPVAFAAELLGIAPPPQVPFAEAAKGMSEMALSFYGESKRVRNNRLRNELGVTLRFPTFREGLRALASSEKA
jgi:nucleoside-diphosphate-sugar epimerase